MENIEQGVTPISIRGPLLFDIFINVMFLFVEKCNSYNHADYSVMNSSYDVETVILNTLRPRQDGCRLPDDIFKCIFFDENVLIVI